MAEVTIFDTPGKLGTLWSHHLFRIIFSLHYKNIPFAINLIEYPDIVPTFERTSLKPKEDPVEPYEIPVLRYRMLNAEEYQYCMRPQDIIHALEEIQPKGALFYNSARSVEFRSRFVPAFAPIIQAVVGHVPDILPEDSARFFIQKRKNRTGMSMEQWKSEHPIEDVHEKIAVQFKDLSDWLDDTVGPFVNGELPSYADFTIASFLCFTHAVGFRDIVEKILNAYPTVRRLFDAVKSTQLDNTHVRHFFEYTSIIHP